MGKLKRFFGVLALCVLTLSVPLPAMAAGWPEQAAIMAEGGIVMDADTGTVLYEKNIHNTYYPASITKILTALIVIENCDLDEMVTFSHNAVFNVEEGSSNAALDVGDTLSVRDCLYAMLLKSANEAANALAEHTSGSIEAFSELMNEKAASLGCVDSHFANPSGLNDPGHYTSAYDMALIAKAAFQNDTFVEIDSTLYYDLPPTKRNPEGLRIYPGHRMLRKNSSQYYPGIIGGKTGYTSLAGNTLVTCAERDGLKLICVVLNGHTTHYTDTATLLNWAFKNFKSVPATDVNPAYAEAGNDMTIAGLPTTDLSVLQLENDCDVVIPNTADYFDVTTDITYDLPEIAPQNAIALISYRYDEHDIGQSFLMLNKDHYEEPVPEVPGAVAADTEDEEELPAEEIIVAEAQAPTKFHITLPDIQISPRMALTILGIILAAAVVTALIVLKYHTEKKEEAERVARHNRRVERLQDIGISTTDFDLLMEKKRTTGSITDTGQPAKTSGIRKLFRKHDTYDDL